VRSHVLAIALFLAAAPAAHAADPTPPAEPAPAVDEAAPPTDEAAPPTDEAAPEEASADPVMDEALAKQRSRAMGLAARGREMLRAGLVDEAVTAYAEALQVWPAYPLVLNELGAIYANKKELARAEALLQRAVELDPEMVAAWANLAEVQRRMGRFAVAVDSYKRVLDREPDDADAFYGLAASFARTGDRPASRWAMERFLALSGEDAEGPRIAEVQDQLERLDDDDVEAKAPWKIASATTKPPPTDPKDETPDDPKDGADEPQVAVAPGEPGPLPRHAGDDKYYLRRYVEALALYQEQLAATEGDDVVLLYKIGATHAVMNDYRSALRVWRRALLIEPDRELIVRHVGLATMKLAEQAPPPAPTITDPLEAARIALIAGDPAQAVARLSEAEGAVAAQLRGEALLLLGDLAGARASFEAILAAHPDDLDATGGLAEALARQGATAPAEAAMRTWLGDRQAPLETFLVLRSDDFVTRLTSEPEE